MQEKIKSFVSHEKFHIPLLLFLGIWFFIPFLGSVNLFDWDELNFAEAAREMLITGNFMRVQIDFHPFWEKPPLFFWLQAASMRVFGITEFAARFVNSLCGIITLVTVYNIGKKKFDALFGLLWAGAFLGSFLPHIFYKSGIIDPVFNLFIMLGFTQICTTTSKEASKKNMVSFLLGGLFIGLAVMTKGPVAFLIVCLCIGVYWVTKRFKPIMSLKHVTLFVSVVCIVNFFFYGIETLLHGTWYIEEFLKYHMRLLTTGEAGHGRPIYYHIIVVLVGCFPASVFAFRYLTNKSAPTSTGQKDFKLWMTILFWVVLVLFSLVKTKTVLYSSLSYFPVTFLAAYHLWALIQAKEKIGSKEVLFLRILLLLLSLVFIAFPILMVHREWVASFVTDTFSQQMLNKQGDWYYGLSLIGLLYLIGMTLCIQVIRRGRLYTGSFSLFFIGALGIQLCMFAFVGRIEHHSQGSMVKFYKELAHEDCYVKSLFKSYAGLFYSNKQPLTQKKAYDKQWLLTGSIDKPAYFVQKVHRAKGLAEKYGLVQIQSIGGYVLFRRNIPEE